MSECIKVAAAAIGMFLFLTLGFTFLVNLADCDADYVPGEYFQKEPAKGMIETLHCAVYGETEDE